MRAAGGSLFAMLILSHLRARRCLDAADAEGLLAGRGSPPRLRPAGGPWHACRRSPPGPAATRSLLARLLLRRSPGSSARSGPAEPPGESSTAVPCDVAAGGTAARVSVVSPPLPQLSPSGSAYSPRTMLSRLQLSQESVAAAR